MASRISLGRIVEWFKNADLEECHLVMHRAGNIIQQRAHLIEQANLHHEKKAVTRTGRKHRDKPEDVRPPAPSASAQDNVSEKAVSAS